MRKEYLIPEIFVGNPLERLGRVLSYTLRLKNGNKLHVCATEGAVKINTYLIFQKIVNRNVIKVALGGLVEFHNLGKMLVKLHDRIHPNLF